jgi:hypothetical protein
MHEYLILALSLYFYIGIGKLALLAAQAPEFLQIAREEELDKIDPNFGLSATFTAISAVCVSIFIWPYIIYLETKTTSFCYAFFHFFVAYDEAEIRLTVRDIVHYFRHGGKDDYGS